MNEVLPTKAITISTARFILPSISLHEDACKNWNITRYQPSRYPLIFGNWTCKIGQEAKHGLWTFTPWSQYLVYCLPVHLVYNSPIMNTVRAYNCHLQCGDEISSSTHTKHSNYNMDHITATSSNNHCGCLQCSVYIKRQLTWCTRWFTTPCLSSHRTGIWRYT